MRLSPLLPLFLIPLSIALTAASAHAQEAPSSVPMARLDFASEGEGCPDAGTFADEVSSRIGRVGFDDASEQVALVRIARTTSEALPLSIAAIVKRDDWGKGTMWGIVGVTSGFILGANPMVALSDDGGTEVMVRPL